MGNQSSLCFNSTMVRLKARMVQFSNRYPCNVFQFHNGSIKGETPEVDQPLKRKQCFNSTMVRLKAINGLASISATSCFNSTMVRLKVGVSSWRCVDALSVSIPQWFD